MMQQFRLYIFILSSLILLNACGGEDSTKNEIPKAYNNPVVLPYTEMIAKDSNNVEAYFQRAQALANVQADSLAIVDFKKATTLDQQNVKYKMAFGDFLFEIKNFKEAAAQYDAVLQLQPKNETAILNIVQTYIQLKDAENAWKYLNPPLKTLPDNPVLNYLTAEIALVEKDTVKAMKIVDGLIQKTPKLYAAQFLKGELLTYQNQDGAVTYFEKAFSLDTMDLLPIEKIGDFYKARKDYPKALKYYRMAVAKDNSYAFGFYKAGLVYQELDSLDKAVQNFGHAIKADLKYPGSYLALAQLYEKENQKDSAKKYYQLTLTFDSKNEAAHAALSRLK